MNKALLREAIKGMQAAVVCRVCDNKQFVSIADDLADLIISKVDEYLLDLGIGFLKHYGEDDKIEAWKKYLNNGGQ